MAPQKQIKRKCIPLLRETRRNISLALGNIEKGCSYSREEQSKSLLELQEGRRKG
jgi:hypothetical protein